MLRASDFVSRFEGELLTCTPCGEKFLVHSGCRIGLRKGLSKQIVFFAVRFLGIFVFVCVFIYLFVCLSALNFFLIFVETKFILYILLIALRFLFHLLPLFRSVAYPVQFILFHRTKNDREN